MTLKEKLLSLGCFEDNEYLDFYLQIILNNLNNPYIKGKTEKHHIIPKIYFKYNNLEVDNSKSNLVSLEHFYHCLAHYYLCLCLKDELRYKNEHAFLKMVNIKSRFEFNYDEFIKQATKYNEIYECFIKEQSDKAKERFKNGGNSKGKHYFTNGKELVCKEVCPEGYWPSATRKGRTASEESKEKYRKAARKRTTPDYKKKMSNIKQEYYLTHKGVTANRTWITNGIEEKLVDLNVYYLNEGWYIGRSDRSRLNNVKAAAKGRKIYNEIQKTK